MTETASIGAHLTAFGAGVLSVLSPCVLPLMPAYLSLISGISVEEMREREAPRLRARVLVASLGFVLGFSAVFVLLGASVALIGSNLRSWQLELFGLRVGITQVAGLLIVVMGLHLAGVLRIPILYQERRFEVGRLQPGPLGAAVVGAAFAFGWTPCIGPILGGILTLAGSQETVAEGITLLSSYSAGLAIPFLAAGWSLERFFEAFRRIRRHFRTLELASGGLLVLVGLLVLTDQFTRLNRYLAFMNSWVLALEEALL
jgi:cytochrome c-type biogenesis protein